MTSFRIIWFEFRATKNAPTNGTEIKKKSLLSFYAVILFILETQFLNFFWPHKNLISHYFILNWH